MIVNYSDEKVVQGKKSIFLAGPSPRDTGIVSWRIDAVNILKELGYDGIVYVPEFKEGALKNYLNQTEWEYEALSKAKIIIFWIPRKLPELPAFTSNVEFGYWIHSKKVVYGRPDNAPKTRYLDWLYKKETGLEPLNNLREILKTAVEKNDEN